MSTRGFVLSCTLALATVATTGRAAADEASFDQLAGKATTITRADLAGLIWSLTASCDQGTDLARRQCRAARDARAASVPTATFLVAGDGAAFAIGAWNPDAKSLPLVLRGCVACVEPVLGHYVVSHKQAPSFVGESAVAAVVHETSRSFKDEAAAKRWAARVSRLRTELVFRVVAANRGLFEREGKRGLAVEILGYRVYDPCDGGIVCASPQSGPAPVDDKGCGDDVVKGADKVEPEDKPVKPAEPVLPAQLEARDIKKAMKPVVDAAKACFDKYGVPGAAKLVYTVSGDGKVLAFELTGEFVDTPTGTCIDKAARTASFPRSRRASFGFTYPLLLQ